MSELSVQMENAVKRTDTKQPSCAYGVMSLASQFETLMRIPTVHAEVEHSQGNERAVLEQLMQTMARSDAMPAISRAALFVLNNCVNNEAWLRELRTCGLFRDATSRNVEPFVRPRTNQQMEMS